MEAQQGTGFTLSDWVVWASLRMGAKLSEHQVQMYCEEISSWGLTEGELQALERLVRRQCDKFPGPASLRTMANAIRFAKQETEPIFVTREDSEGRVWAKPTQLRRPVSPSSEDLERWKAEAAAPEEAREAWREAFYLKGLDPESPAPKNGAHGASQPFSEPIRAPELYRIVLGLETPEEYERHRAENPIVPGKADYDDSLPAETDDW